MNRKARRRMAKVGDIIETTTIRVVHPDGTRWLYWIVVPEGMTNQHAAETQEWHGPFKTDAEVTEDQRITLLGPQGKLKHGGNWDPAWNRPQ
jgi:hypothetical protein